MRSPALQPLDVLVGEWSLTLTDCWFLESRQAQQRGHATGRWLADAFVELEAEMEGVPVWHFVFGRNDANGELVVLYHDPRPTSRVFRMTVADDEWALVREDPTSISVSSPTSVPTGSMAGGTRPRTEANPGARTSI